LIRADHQALDFRDTDSSVEFLGLLGWDDRIDVDAGGLAGQGLGDI
jgi:hypothetical protein